MDVKTILKNSTNNLHGLKHVKNLNNLAKQLIEAEDLFVDQPFLDRLILWHDAGKAKWGDNIVTTLFDGPISAVMYFLESRYGEYSNLIFKSIWAHTRLLFFLGSAVDKFLYRPDTVEEKILFDIDLLDMIDPERVKHSRSLTWAQKLVMQSVDKNHFYFDFSKKIFDKHKVSLKK